MTISPEKGREPSWPVASRSRHGNDPVTIAAADRTGGQARRGGQLCRLVWRPDVAFDSLGSLLSYIVPFLFVLHGRRLLPRARPFPGRPLVRREGRRLLAGIRPGTLRLHRPQGDALAPRRVAARRLCEIPSATPTPPAARDPRTLPRVRAAERAVTFFGQPVWKRAAIVAAGPIANFILAIVIFTGLFFAFGRAGPVAARRCGDARRRGGSRPASSRAIIVLAIDGRTIDSFAGHAADRVVLAGTPLTFVVDRRGVATTLEATPQLKELYRRRSASTASACSASTARPRPEDWRTERYGSCGFRRLAGQETWFIIERDVHLYRRAVRRPRIGRSIVRPDRHRPESLAKSPNSASRPVSIWRPFSRSRSVCLTFSRSRCSMAAT